MSILNPLYDAVAWIVMRIHAVLAVPFGASSGWAWGLTIVILVIIMRLLLLPLFIKQVRSQRKMLAVAPQLQELRKRYKNDRQKLSEETMKFYKENGVNPLGGCLPLVGQFPVFISLFNVLRFIAEWKPHQPLKYGLTQSVVESARQAHVFGASLADRFLFQSPPPAWSVRSVILVTVAVSAFTTFMTMRQSSKRGMMQQPTTDPDNPAANMQKYMMYIAPFFALTGLYWQYGLVLYWVSTNIWTLGQQYFMFRNMPIVGSGGLPVANGKTPSDGKAPPRRAVQVPKSSVSGKSPGSRTSGGKPAGGRPAGAKPAGSRPADVTSSNGRPANGVPADAGQAGDAAPADAKAKPAQAKQAKPAQEAKPSQGKPAQAGTSQAKAKQADASRADGKSTEDKAANGRPVRSGKASGGKSDTGGKPADGGRGLLRLGRSKAEPEPEPEPETVKYVRHQPTRQTRSKRSGKR